MSAIPASRPYVQRWCSIHSGSIMNSMICGRARGSESQSASAAAHVELPAIAQFYGLGSGTRTSFRRRNHGVKGGLYLAQIGSPTGVRLCAFIHSRNRARFCS